LRAGLVNLEWKGKIEDGFILDANAKMLFRLSDLKQNNAQIDLSSFPIGLSFLKLLKKDGIVTKKILINR